MSEEVDGHGQPYHEERPRFTGIEAGAGEGKTTTETIPAPTGIALFQSPNEMRKHLDAYAEGRRIFIEWVFANLTPGVDFMLIHRSVGPKGAKVPCPNQDDKTSRNCARCGGKATLCKPGSEKVCGLLEVRPVFSKDADVWEMFGSKAGLLCLICSLTDRNGSIVAEGRGARDIQADYGDANKTVKMTEKSAQADAVLRLGGLSEVFTQDLEDMPSSAIDRDEAPKTAPEAPQAPDRAEPEREPPLDPLGPQAGAGAQGTTIRAWRLKREGVNAKDTQFAKKGDKWSVWELTDSNGTTYTTFSETFAAVAEEAHRSGRAVEVTGEANPPYRELRLTDIRIVGEADATKPAPDFDTARFTSLMETERKRLGDDDFNLVLATFGCEKVSDVPNGDVARAIYKKMQRGKR